ncbi:uncharacterized protein N7459_007706 [Penicillium hispanicum]|uniref:uncharacterized protein n=1 Tax=Penicillium hispanicum TaxID=1080232 RepID=UPI002540F847|nr:uncharacterized protein N7459_007706 [Penicillium hispanicum]KAJ5578742.1 hypothetical protein N7459_007706 [Penicillium hispanicum]
MLMARVQVLRHTRPGARAPATVNHTQPLNSNSAFGAVDTRRIMVGIADDTARRGESQPLLAANIDVDADAAVARSIARRNAKKLWVVIACAIFVVAAEFGFYLSQAPQTAIFEQIICRNHLRVRGIAPPPPNVPDAEDPCKSEFVQGELALVLGYKDTFDVLPTLLLSLPYGVLSDHWGRKPVMYLGLVGVVLGEIWVRLVSLWSNVLPLRMVWLSGLWRVIGGGDQVVVSMALVMIADIFSEEERSTTLFRIQSCVVLAEIFAAPVSAYFMDFDPWFPFMLGTVLIVIAGIPIVFLPETLEDAKAKMASRPNMVSAHPREDAAPLDKKSVLEEIIRTIREFKEGTRFIWTDGNVCLMVLVLFVTMMSRQSTNMLLQYASKRFHWSIARASLLISLRGIFAMVTYLVLMPALSWIAARYLDLHGKFQDHRFSQWTGVVSVVGFTAMALAPVPVLLIGGLAILSMGSSFLVTNRSLATALVLPDHVGTLYSAVTLSQSIGTVIAGPLFAYLFKLGMHFGDAWMGLPFLQAALFYVVATVAVWNIRLSRKPSSSEADEECEALLSE